MSRFALAVSFSLSVLALPCLLGLDWPALGHEGHEHPPEVPAADVYRAARLPDRIVLTFTGDPAHTQSVTWRTSPRVERAFAEIAVAEAGPQFRDKAQRQAALTRPFASDLGDVHYHEATFKGLSPGAKYAYRVGDGTNWSEWFHFTTASDRPEPFSFIYFGDAQNDLRSLWSRVIREAYGDAPQARFMIHAGDLVNNGNRDAEWGQWFGAGAWLNAMMPSVPSPGNHEYPKLPAPEGEEAKRALCRPWRPQFALPENGPEGLEETAYWIDYQGARIVSLNSNEQLARQAEWLDRLLSDNPNAWTVLAFHHPVFSTAEDRDNPELRAAWKPIIDKHRVDLVLQGHDHTYGRTGLDVTENVATGAQTRSPEGGTVFVVSVSGPKMYDLERRPIFRRAAEDTQLYQIISIDGDTLRYEARTAVGAVYDAFTLQKRPGQTNELTEEQPATPERLRGKK
jgi:3',5'-cyclic AMP phosphodiesterase CpdA